MKLYERQPKHILVKGRKYRVNFDFRRVLLMLDVLRDKSLTPEAREYLALKCVMRAAGGNTHDKLEAVKAALFESNAEEQQKKITDFEQDAGMIRAAFRQIYDIDLWHDRLGWHEFTELLQWLPEGNRYVEVLGIRARPIPKANKFNAEERQRLYKAKAAYALKMTDEERENTYQASLHRTTQSLLRLAKRGEKNNGNDRNG